MTTTFYVSGKFGDPASSALAVDVPVALAAIGLGYGDRVSGEDDPEQFMGRVLLAQALPAMAAAATAPISAHESTQLRHQLGALEQLGRYCIQARETVAWA